VPCLQNGLAELEGDLPSSIANIGGGLDYLYIQNEHTHAARQFFCRQRISQSAIGRKHNWQMLANEFINYNQPLCANPYDVHEAFEALSGDV